MRDAEEMLKGVQHRFQHGEKIARLLICDDELWNGEKG
jgi:hypothetical protein